MFCVPKDFTWLHINMRLNVVVLGEPFQRRIRATEKTKTKISRYVCWTVPLKLNYAIIQPPCVTHMSHTWVTPIIPTVHIQHGGSSECVMSCLHSAEMTKSLDICLVVVPQCNAQDWKWRHWLTGGKTWTRVLVFSCTCCISSCFIQTH